MRSCSKASALLASGSRSTSRTRATGRTAYARATGVCPRLGWQGWRGCRRSSGRRVAKRTNSAIDTWLENLHRKDLSPLERGEMLVLLMKRFELPRSAETASRLGLSKTSFYRYLALKDAPADVKKALTDGVVGVAQAERIAAIQTADARATLIQAAKEGVPAERIDEALEGYRAGAVNSRDLLKAGVRSRANGRKGGGHEPDMTWARAKVRELRQSLGLKASDLKPIALALEARRINSAHATAAALLVVAGRAGKEALDEAACIEKNALKAVETLFRVSQRAESGARQDTGRMALRKILEMLGVRGRSFGVQRDLVK